MIEALAGVAQPASGKPAIYLAECSHDRKQARDLIEGELRSFEGLTAGSLREDILTHTMLAIRGEDQPMRIHLGDFLGQCHPPEKIGDAFRYRQSRVFVGICSHGF